MRNLKKIAQEIGETLSDDELKEIMEDSGSMGISALKISSE
jgi:hypothetical protein